MSGLAAWIDTQYRHAAQGMLRSVSPLGLVKSRPGFGQTILPRRGAIIASPVLAAYDPDPDYFFHWYRDAAIVIDALRELYEDGSATQPALVALGDYVHFSLALGALDGRRLLEQRAWQDAVAADFKRFLRTDADLGAAHDQNIAAETRVNADGSLDVSHWARPQHDGPALRALTLLRWARSAAFDAPLAAAAAALLRADLRFTRQRCSEPCFDIWEEKLGLHYYTLCVAAAALADGAVWLEGQDGAEAQQCRTAAAAIRRSLEGYWLPQQGYYRSRLLPAPARSAKELDIAVILAAIHARGSAGAHSVHDPRMHATLAQLERLFDAEYAINRDRPAGRAPALGRYAGDVYYSGGAYYFSTLAAAELCFRAAAVGTSTSTSTSASASTGVGTSTGVGVGVGASASAREVNALIQRGDAFLQTVRAYTPDSGDMSEQFDQHSGAQSSAKQLAWSYAAFITCIAARRAIGL
jgi:glucoamylase